MSCLKCGLEGPDVFCASCLEEMEQHPVSRETPVVILPRPEISPPRRRPPRAEELLAKARRRLRRLLIVCTLLALLCIALTLTLFLSREENTRPIGQNYITNTNEGTGGEP